MLAVVPLDLKYVL